MENNGDDHNAQGNLIQFFKVALFGVSSADCYHLKMKSFHVVVKWPR